MQGLLPIVIIFANLIGMGLNGLLAYPFHGSQSYSFTLTLWLSVLVLNWIALLVICYTGAWYKNSTNPIVKKIGKILFFAWIILVIFDAENKQWHLIEKLKTWLHAS